MSVKSKSVATLAGVGFAVFGIAGTLAYPSTPSFADEPAVIAEYYVGHETAVLAGATLYVLGAALLMVFAVALRSALTRADSGNGNAPAIAYAGAIGGATLLMAAASMDAMAVLRVGERGTIDPQVATMFWDASMILYGLAAATALALPVLATAVVSIRNSVLPAWFGWISIALGVSMLVPPISHVGVIVFTFWALVASLMLYLRPAPSVDAPIAETAPAGA